MDRTLGTQPTARAVPTRQRVSSAPEHLFFRSPPARLHPGLSSATAIVHSVAAGGEN